MPGKAVTEQAQISLGGNGYRSTRAANFPNALAPYAHYVLFAHDYPEQVGSSGQCCEPNRGNNKDIIVTLGSWRVQMRPGLREGLRRRWEASDDSGG